jgi:hypothetical protein
LSDFSWWFSLALPRIKRHGLQCFSGAAFNDQAHPLAGWSTTQVGQANVGDDGDLRRVSVRRAEVALGQELVENLINSLEPCIGAQNGVVQHIELPPTSALEIET